MDSKDINDQDKWSRFVAKLLSDTVEGKIEWKDMTSLSPRDSPDEHIQSPLFVAEIVGKKYVAVYQYRSQEWHDSDEFHWETDVAVELVRSAGATLWRIPGVPERHALFDAIRYVTAGAEETWNEYLMQDSNR